MKPLSFHLRLQGSPLTGKSCRQLYLFINKGRNPSVPETSVGSPISQSGLCSSPGGKAHVPGRPQCTHTQRRPGQPEADERLQAWAVFAGGWRQRTGNRPMRGFHRLSLPWRLREGGSCVARPSATAERQGGQTGNSRGCRAGYPALPLLEFSFIWVDGIWGWIWFHLEASSRLTLLCFISFYC